MKRIMIIISILFILISIFFIFIYSLLQYTTFYGPNDLKAIEFDKVVASLNQQIDKSNDLVDPSNNFGRGADGFYNSQEYVNEANRILELLIQLEYIVDIACKVRPNKSLWNNCLDLAYRGNITLLQEASTYSAYGRESTFYLADNYYFQAEQEFKLCVRAIQQSIFDIRQAIDNKNIQKVNDARLALATAADFMSKGLKHSKMAKSIEDQL